MQVSRRYFVLRGTRLYYFKTWEDYGAGGLRSAINLASPIDLTSHLPAPLRNGAEGLHRFDLAPISDPLARKWQLQAATAEEAADWVTALRAANELGREVEAERGARARASMPARNVVVRG